MHRYLALAALILAAPVAAQTAPPVDHSSMLGMNNGMQAKPGQPMQAVDHSKMGGMADMMKNTPANPYAEAGMAMHHKMMVVGADASETWARQMIEHHRGAIAMSRIAVAQAGDKELRTMAQKVVNMQVAEVASLQSWLKRHGKNAQ
jgi:uncharacterized protein (DUF305 family)|nr:DUF305 domain-containing protein [Sandarakinorhabdus sp.]